MEGKQRTRKTAAKPNFVKNFAKVSRGAAQV